MPIRYIIDSEYVGQQNAPPEEDFWPIAPTVLPPTVLFQAASNFHQDEIPQGPFVEEEPWGLAPTALPTAVYKFVNFIDDEIFPPVVTPLVFEEDSPVLTPLQPIVYLTAANYQQDEAGFLYNPIEETEWPLAPQVLAQASYQTCSTNPDSVEVVSQPIITSTGSWLSPWTKRTSIGGGNA